MYASGVGGVAQEVEQVARLQRARFGGLAARVEHDVAHARGDDLRAGVAADLDAGDVPVAVVDARGAVGVPGIFPARLAEKILAVGRVGVVVLQLPREVGVGDLLSQRIRR